MQKFDTDITLDHIFLYTQKLFLKIAKIFTTFTKNDSLLVLTNVFGSILVFETSWLYVTFMEDFNDSEKNKVHEIIN